MLGVRFSGLFLAVMYLSFGGFNQAFLHHNTILFSNQPFLLKGPVSLFVVSVSGPEKATVASGWVIGIENRVPRFIAFTRRFNEVSLLSNPVVQRVIHLKD